MWKRVKTALLSSSSYPRNEAEEKKGHRILYKDLGRTDCQGWLWIKQPGGPSAGGVQKWCQRWTVIKNGVIYCCKQNTADETEFYISLPGYKIAPATDCKRKLAFQITHPKRDTFYFASEQQTDMTKWMNKIGLAAIEYNSEDTKLGNASVNDNLSDSELEGDVFTTTQDPSPASTKKISDNEENLHTDARLSISSNQGSPTVDLLEDEQLKATDDEQPIIAKTNIHVRSSVQSESIESNDSCQEEELIGTSFSTQPVSSPKKLQRLLNVIPRKHQKRSHSFPTSSEPSNKPRKSSTITQNSGATGHPSNLVGDGATTRVCFGAAVAKDACVTSTNPATSDSPDTSNTDTQKIVTEPAVKFGTEKRNDDLFSTIKQSCFDIQGNGTLSTWRRRMTVLSRDPVRNEKMLKKRALQRQLKAKEQELLHVDELLVISNLTSEVLHDWIAQHPSVVADMEIIKRSSQRQLRNQSDTGSISDKPEDDNRDLNFPPNRTMTTDATSPDVFDNNEINNQGNIAEMRTPAPGNFGRAIRPRTWAMSRTYSPEFANKISAQRTLSSSAMPSSSREPDTKPHSKSITSNRDLAQIIKSAPRTPAHFSLEL